MAAPMPLGRLLTDTVELVERVEDPDQPGTWAEADAGALPAYVQQRTTNDVDAGGAVVVTSEYLVVVPYIGAVVDLAPAAVLWHGRLLEVIGAGTDLWNPRVGAISHTELRCREVT
jgi:hypothetical protein